MKAHLFGPKCSLSCASFCQRETVCKYGKLYDPHVAETYQRLYADNCLVACNTDEAAFKMNC